MSRFQMTEAGRRLLNDLAADALRAEYPLQISVHVVEADEQGALLEISYVGKSGHALFAHPLQRVSKHQTITFDGNPEIEVHPA